MHRALAEVTDPQIDPDRRAWHRAPAASGPMRTSPPSSNCRQGGPRPEGGLAGSAAFLERAALLIPEPARRARRMLAAARAKCDAGALDALLGLLVAVEAGPINARQGAEIEHLRGQIALVQRRGQRRYPLLLSAATRLEPLDGEVAREMHLEALGAAIWAGDLNDPAGVRRAAEAAGPRRLDPTPRGRLTSCSTRSRCGSPTDTRRYADAHPGPRAVPRRGHQHAEVRSWLWQAGSRAGAIIALELWDYETWDSPGCPPGSVRP